MTLKPNHRFFLIGAVILIMMITGYAIAETIHGQYLLSKLFNYSELQDTVSKTFRVARDEFDKQKLTTATQIGQKVPAKILNEKRQLIYERKCPHTEPLWIHEQELSAWVLCPACAESTSNNTTAWQELLKRKEAVEDAKQEFNHIAQEREAFFAKHFNHTTENGEEIWQAKSLSEIWFH